ncbi:adenosylcobinamide-GDP ribazoletransferase [Neobacillus pocheonensis]|uniref:Adenosylcobinamide-GDP ribazoletransferase n=1 Tax=Neobacillus pocheonensis TaxID=363869 RepID=A0ABT0W9E3_9BACI|nr:adenosylcobinamide-GDP ribazoletransferase [Neobacillus pocheonensis]
MNLLLILTITYLLTGVYGLLLFLITAIITGLFILKIYQKLNMLTGDCYGAIVEWSECITLFLALAIWRFAG